MESHNVRYSLKIWLESSQGRAARTLPAVDCALEPNYPSHRFFHALARHHSPTAAHCMRVRWYALLYADHVGMESVLRRQVGVAAMLHDIGKLLVSPELLDKPGPLTRREFSLIQEHAAAGEKI